MDSELAQKAILAALNGKWKDAVKYNKSALKDCPNDVQTLNRLAKAYCELGKVNQARLFCKKVIKIDPFDSIALRNLENWENLKASKKTSSRAFHAADFIEEPGKTQLVSLLYLGDPHIISELSAGEELILSPHSHRVSVTTKDFKHIGKLPDDLSAKLRGYIELGNSYRVIVKSVDQRNVVIFIREMD
ncbi:MAG: tetratricopeptide repeat protein [bacterium]|nr:tetratricopeptide repeat protein [bacterium]